MCAWAQVEAAAREQREAIEGVLHRRELSPRVRERTEMVKAVALGYGLEAIATWSGRSVRTVGYWLERFVASGLAALADAPRAGRPPRATPAYLAALEAAVSTPPRTLGLEFDVWTSDRLSAYLAEQTGIRLSPGWLRVLLAERDWVSGRPKLSVRHLRQPAEVAACGAALEAAGKKVAADLEHRELHHEDETHLDTNPYLRRMWHRRGQQAVLPAAGTNRRLTAFGSVEVFGRGRVEVLCADQSSAGFQLYLDALDQRHAATGREITLVFDNGSAQCSEVTRAALQERAAWLHVLPLARYCPN